MSKKKLKNYQEKRDFSKTPEPRGNTKNPSAKPIFVIQQHGSRSGHYDLRIEDNGVLLSWAIPKGPSTNPADKQLAIMTEDHPLDYATFEGTIPEGSYGAGPVIVWDTGTFRNLKNNKSFAQSIKDGEATIWLEGTKLKGGYALIRTNYQGKNTNWLLIKMNDDKADRKKNITKELPNSVISGAPLGKAPFMKIDRHTIALSNLNKQLLGSYTKGDIITYYTKIADKMVPYLKNRPLMMHRFPDGLEGEAFYQKNASDYFPSWIKTVRIEKKKGHYTSVMAQNKATLVYLANQACITPHIWLSRYDRLNVPDRIIFDLDPSIEDFSMVRKVALALKKLLDELGLVSFAMTSGSKGLHIYVPLRRTEPFEVTKAFAKACAEHVIAEHPELATLEIRKDKRGNKVFIDILRNQQGSTSVAPYAIRAKNNAPIATPIEWSLVKLKTLHPQQFTLENIFDQIDSDPWQEFFAIRQTLTKELLRNFLPI